MWDEESVKNLSLVSLTILSPSVLLHCLRSELGTFVDWKTDWGSVVLTGCSRLISDKEELSRRQLAPPKPYLYQALEFRQDATCLTKKKSDCRESSCAKCSCTERKDV